MVVPFLIGSDQTAWLLRAAELPLVLGLFLWTPIPAGPVTLTLLAFTALAWLVWLVCWPWGRDPSRFSAPHAALLAVIAAAAGLTSMSGGNHWADALMLVPCLHAATWLRPVASVVPAAAVAGSVSGARWLGGESLELIPVVAGIGLVFLSGVARGLRLAQLRAARDGEAERIRGAALAERTRIAREIHDILAHSLADLSIQLQLADALLTDGGDTTGAVDRIRHAHRLAADGLAETQRAVHALRTDAPPLPDALAALAGTGAALGVTGVPRPLSAAAGLALLRTAQEALTNARRHAPGTKVTIELVYAAGRTTLTVRNAAGPPASGVTATGYGLAGMTERLRLAGGSLTAGVQSGGWTVHAEVPA